MTINYIPNDPLVRKPGMRQQKPRPNRPSGRAGLTFTSSAPEGTYDPATQLRSFLYWQAREAVLDAIETWEGLDGSLARWSEEADDPKKLVVDLDHDDPQFTGPSKLNAFYDRTGLRFFIYDDGTHTWASGQSTDTVSHETGHALLDTIRPDFWGSFKAEVPAFHESFGDCWALMTALADPEIRAQVLHDSADLRSANFVEANSEYLSSAIKQTFGKVAASEPRHALNQFQWQLPASLPPGDFRDPPSKLSVEPHSFSRVFTGCFYDTLTGIFAAASKQNPDTLWEAAQTAGKLLIAAARGVALSSRFFRDLGRAMILADQQQNHGRCRAVIGAAFAGHGLSLGSAAALFPEAVLDGPAPIIVRDGVRLAAATIKDLRNRLQAARGGKLDLGIRTLAGKKVVEATHWREVPLDAVDRRLRGVVALASEPVMVGGSGGRAALLGIMPEPYKTEDEVQTFVASLVQNGQIQFEDKKRSRRPLAAVAPEGGEGVIPTHAVRTKGGKKLLERMRFVCGCR